MTLPEVPGDNSMPVEPLQVQSPIIPMENVSPQVHSQDVADEGMTLTPDIPVSTQFYTKTCGCDKAQGNPCSTLFTLDYIIEMRAQCNLLSHDELDLVLMGFISSTMLDSDGIRDGRHQNSANEDVSPCHLSIMAIMSVKRHFSSYMALAMIDSRLSRNTIKNRGYKCGNMGTANVPHNTQYHLQPLGML